MFAQTRFSKRCVIAKAFRVQTLREKLRGNLNMFVRFRSQSKRGMSIEKTMKSNEKLANRHQ